jgi:hypothetical protein
MTTAEMVSSCIAGAGVLATFLATALALLLAIYGDRLKAWRTGPKLRLVLKNPKGAVLLCSNTKRRHYYTLSVVNDRPGAIANNCCVRLTHLWRSTPDGRFVPVPIAYPLVLSWPPSEVTPWAVSVGREELVDFGFLEESSSFQATARVYPNNFDGLVRAGEAVRYGLEIISDQFASKQPQVFEVCWDGEWIADPDRMAGHLRIREVQL